jgi:hypothetical protein
MKKKALILTTLFATLLTSSVTVTADEAKKPSPVVVKKKTMLFNGKNLDGWTGFLPQKEEIEKNWSAAKGVMRCEGKAVGYIRTVNSYANYKLHVEWRWPEKPSNSGVLLHRQSKDQPFPLCIEAQLKSGNAGDLVMMSGGAITVDGKEIVAKKFAVAKKKNPSNEKPIGEWNSYDIVCDNGAITIVVNGAVQNGGIAAKPASGQIALQSEGGPIEFRNVYVQPLD